MASFKSTTRYHSRLEKCVFQMLDCQIPASHAADPPVYWGVVTKRLYKKNFKKERFLKIRVFLASSVAGAHVCEDPRPHAWSMCAACFCSCISQSRATPLGRSRYQTSELPTTSEFPTELPTHSISLVLTPGFRLRVSSVQGYLDHKKTHPETLP